MRGIVVSLDLIGVSLFHAHHAIDPVELYIGLLIIVEILRATLGDLNRFDFFDTVSLTV